jgi:hypothetical protein
MTSITPEKGHVAVHNDDNAVPTEDWLLQDLVRLANRYDGFSVGVTITTRGGVITGSLIGVREYFREYGRLWAQVMGGGELGDQIAAQWAKRGEDDMAEVINYETHHYNYVHIKDARIVAGTSIVPTAGGFLWRGRIAEASGFALGSLKPERTVAG